MTNNPIALRVLLDTAHAVLFDFDGPICDVFAGLPASSVARQLESILGAKFETNDPLEILRQSTRFGKPATQAIEDELISAELEAIASSIPTTGGLESIESCLSANKEVGIVSNNSRQAVDQFLKNMGLNGRIRLVIGRAYASPELMKPHPQALQSAFTNLQISPQQAVFIGDSVTDIQAGKAVNTAVVAYANSAKKRDTFYTENILVVESMLEIANSIGRKNEI